MSGSPCFYSRQHHSTSDHQQIRLPIASHHPNPGTALAKHLYQINDSPLQENHSSGLAHPILRRQPPIPAMPPLRSSRCSPRQNGEEHTQYFARHRKYIDMVRMRRIEEERVRRIARLPSPSCTDSEDEDIVPENLGGLCCQPIGWCSARVMSLTCLILKSSLRYELPMRPTFRQPAAVLQPTKPPNIRNKHRHPHRLFPRRRPDIPTA